MYREGSDESDGDGRRCDVHAESGPVAQIIGCQPKLEIATTEVLQMPFPMHKWRHGISIFQKVIVDSSTFTSAPASVRLCL